MEKFGTVKSISGEYMTISIVRDSACGDNCAACGLCGNNRLMSLRMKYQNGFQVGDKVRLISDDNNVVSHSAIGYLSLTFLLIFGATIGGILGGDWFAFCGGLLGLFIGILILKLFFTEKMEIAIEKIEE